MAKRGKGCKGTGILKNRLLKGAWGKEKQLWRYLFLLSPMVFADKKKTHTGVVVNFLVFYL
jgi:hypothetical protein